MLVYTAWAGMLVQPKHIHVAAGFQRHTAHPLCIEVVHHPAETLGDMFSRPCLQWHPAVSVLFADISSYTAMSTQVEPEQVRGASYLWGGDLGANGHDKRCGKAAGQPAPAVVGQVVSGVLVFWLAGMPTTGAFCP
jgi:hypothetical protein